MRWFKLNIRGSIYSLLGPAFGLSQSVAEDRVEDIRDAMGPAGGIGYKAVPSNHAAFAIRACCDNLWQLRPNLMAALAAIYGEEAARLQVAAVTLMFDGLLPRGLKWRPSPLGLR